MRSNTRAASIPALAATLVLAVSSTGCLNGAIYTHTTQPLDTDFADTPVHEGGRGDSWKSLVIPLFYYPGALQFDWGDMSIANALSEAGIDTVHYADLETRSILGIWTERWVHVYGETTTSNE